MKINYQTLEKKIKINFKDKDLLVRSFPMKKRVYWIKSSHH